MKIIYWSQTGNTEAMADAVAEGVTKAGGVAEVLQVGSVNASDLEGESAFALGCPAMGAEGLDESEMEPFVSELEGSVAGKNIALFGSYGWGGGEWMNNWVERMEKAGAKVVGGEGVICQGAPSQGDIEACMELGRKLV